MQQPVNATIEFVISCHPAAVITARNAGFLITLCGPTEVYHSHYAPPYFIDVKTLK